VTRGTDEDGDPFRTYILSKDIVTGTAATDRKLTNHQKLALEALTEVLLATGQPAPQEYGLPNGIKVAAIENWKNELYRRGVLDAEAANPRARLTELRKSLQARKLIGVRDAVLWLPQTDAPHP
jgi:hypothetical protein